MATVRDRVGCAIVGTGDRARLYGQVIAASTRGRLIAVCGSELHRAQEIARPHGAVGTVCCDELLANRDVQAVVFANHPQRHVLAVNAARAGKHVLVEKPLAPTIAEGQAIVDACRDAAVVASSVFQLRFGQNVAYVRTAIAENQVGTIRSADAFYFSHRSPEYYRAGNGWRLGPSGGVVMNRLIHHVDLMCHFLGPASSLSATIRRCGPHASVDTEATLLLGFEGGVTGVVRGSDTCRSSDAVLFGIHGDLGTIWMRGDTVLLSHDPLGGLLRQGRAVALRRALGIDGQVVRRSEGTAQDQLEDFLDAIQSGRSPSVTIQDGLCALRIVLAAHASAARGGSVAIHRPPDEGGVT
jgi:UDP-N-acetyl-2-amino-2-deoxyglucuronate dehydrogenase